ncbi:MAG: hypothetical protein WBQ84_15490, partial [Methylocella sp.]
MIDFPKEFDSRHWWILVGVAGALIAAASAPVKFVPGFIIGLALLLFGVGQWIDHPLLTGVGRGFQTTRYPWKPSVVSVALSLSGIGLFGFGLY